MGGIYIDVCACVVVIVYGVEGRVLLLQGMLVNGFGHSRVM